MLSRNNWLPFAAVLVVAALFYAVVEARLSTLVVLDTKMAALELRLGAMERSSSRGEARLELETQKLENKLELTSPCLERGSPTWIRTSNLSAQSSAARSRPANPARSRIAWIRSRAGLERSPRL